MTQTTSEYPIWKAITASAAGTMIEWYDFYIFGSLAAIMSGLFFPKENPVVGFLLTLVTIRLIPLWVAQWGWERAFMPLAIGPALGIQVERIAPTPPP